MMCLSSEGQLDHYWLDSGGTGWIDHVLLSDEVQEDLQNLAAGRSIESNITKHINFATIHHPAGLFSLLLFSGYLSPVAQILEEDIYDLSVYKLSAPNKEVRHIYSARILQWISEQLQRGSGKYYPLISLLPAGRIEEFKQRMQELLLGSTSFHQVGEKKPNYFIATLCSDLLIC